MRATVVFHSCSGEFQGGFSIPGLRDIGFQHLAFVIDGAPQVMCEAVDLHIDLVQVPAPVGQGAHAVDPLATDFGSEHRAKPVPPEPHRLVAGVDAALVDTNLGGKHVFIGQIQSTLPSRRRPLR